MNALVLVDLQNDFIPGGALAVRTGDEVIPVARQLMSGANNFFNYVIATQDWHPAAHESFASRHPGSNPGDLITLHGLSQVLWPDHCVQGTKGARFVAGLELDKIDAIFQKGKNPQIDSYSGFFDNASRQNAFVKDASVHMSSTGLDLWLRDRNVRKLYIVGLATDYCVKFTVLDALALGFEVEVVLDGCRAVDLKPGDGERAIELMQKSGAKVCVSKDLMLSGKWEDR
jgi:nicotinamidase/pyrazinamidase